VLRNLATNMDPVKGGKLPFEVATATLTSTYAVGQNLQMFSTVVHLDRDTWNSETMKQRTARAWRAGQESAVEERTLDVTYSDTKKKGDQTLDDVRKVIQDMDSALFDEVVVDSQAEVLGVEWHNMKKNESALHEVNKRMLEMAMSPYAANLAEESCCPPRIHARLASGTTTSTVSVAEDSNRSPWLPRRWTSCASFRTRATRPRRFRTSLRCSPGSSSAMSRCPQAGCPAATSTTPASLRAFGNGSIPLHR
jgi:hypothetical protein